jgi:hypothetical protein
MPYFSDKKRILKTNVRMHRKCFAYVMQKNCIRIRFNLPVFVLYATAAFYCKKFISKTNLRMAQNIVLLNRVWIERIAGNYANACLYFTQF